MPAPACNSRLCCAPPPPGLSVQPGHTVSKEVGPSSPSRWGGAWRAEAVHFKVDRGRDNRLHLHYFIQFPGGRSGQGPFTLWPAHALPCPLQKTGAYPTNGRRRSCQRYCGSLHLASDHTSVNRKGTKENLWIHSQRITFQLYGCVKSVAINCHRVAGKSDGLQGGREG